MSFLFETFKSCGSSPSHTRKYMSILTTDTVHNKTNTKTDDTPNRPK